MTDQRRLLSEYVATGTDQSFRELVTRYINLVYSVALRMVDGDAHRAEDVVQTVFADLARLAGRLSPEVMLGGWLHRRTCHVAATMMRNERRRQKRERQAAQMNILQDQEEARLEEVLPLLDQAINQLSASDRAAIILRFFEGRDFRSVGQMLAASEDAAQKRVRRAVEKLRGLLRRQGVALSGAGLASLLSVHAVTAAPASLAAGVSLAALAGSAGACGFTVSLLRLIATAKFKLASTVLIGCLATGLVMEKQAQARLRHEAQGLQEQAGMLETVRAEHERLATLAVRPVSLEPPLAELARLRDEVAVLRQQQPKFESARARSGFRPKESFAFSGYSKPEAALESFMWAATTGNVKTMMDSLPPEALQQALRNKSEEEVVAPIIKHAREVSGYRIVHQETLAPDQVAAWVYYSWGDGYGGQLEKIILRRVGADWKYDGHPEPSEALPFQVGAAKVEEREAEGADQ